MGSIWNRYGNDEYGTDGCGTQEYVTDMGPIWNRYATDMKDMNMGPMDMGPKVM